MPTPATFLPDLRSPKSPKRFFAFSKEPLPPLPPLPLSGAYSPPPLTIPLTPNSSYSSGKSPTLGYGAQIVRRPSDARRGMRQPLTAGLVTSSASREESRPFAPTSAPMLRPVPNPPLMRASPPHRLLPLSSQASNSLRERKPNLKLKSSISSTTSSNSPSWDTPESDWDRTSRRSTVRPPPRMRPPSPFSATLLSQSTRPSPNSSSHVLVTLAFGYSLDDPPSNTTVTLSWEHLRYSGGYVVRFIEHHLNQRAEEEAKPEMTDGESADETDSDLASDSGLDALLRYAKSPTSSGLADKG